MDRTFIGSSGDRTGNLADLAVHEMTENGD
jgi:hypothetical protein